MNVYIIITSHFDVIKMMYEDDGPQDHLLSDLDGPSDVLLVTNQWSNGYLDPWNNGINFNGIRQLQICSPKSIAIHEEFLPSILQEAGSPLFLFRLYWNIYR